MRAGIRHQFTEADEGRMEEILGEWWGRLRPGRHECGHDDNKELEGALGGILTSEVAEGRFGVANEDTFGASTIGETSPGELLRDDGTGFATSG
ncbi:MAG: hypothetical protein AAGD22_01015 [Verrucomicrobiota bacterium]